MASFSRVTIQFRNEAKCRRLAPLGLRQRHCDGLKKLRVVLRHALNRRLAPAAIGSHRGAKSPAREHGDQMGRITSAKQALQLLKEMGKCCGLSLGALELFCRNVLNRFGIEHTEDGGPRRDRSALTRVFVVLHPRPLHVPWSMGIDPASPMPVGERLCLRTRLWLEHPITTSGCSTKSIIIKITSLSICGR